MGYYFTKIVTVLTQGINVSLEIFGLSGVTVFGTADFAIDRETAVTVTTLTAADIQERIGNLELPEMLNSTPGVYATRGWGCFWRLQN